MNAAESHPMKYILRFTRDPGVHWYFVNHGSPWTHRPGFRLIGETTQDRANARRFDTADEALAALKLSDDPPGWSIDEVGE